MQKLVRYSTALALVLLPASAIAQTTITITTTETHRPAILNPEQRTVIYRTITEERRVAPGPVVVPPPGPAVRYEVGAPIPREVVVSDFPEDAYIEMPELRHYRYVYVNNRLVLVDSATSRVVDVIAE